MSWLILDGMFDEEDGLILDGMGPGGPLETDDSFGKQFVSVLPQSVRGYSDVSFLVETDPGEEVTMMIRGLGQLGVFRKAVCEDADWEFDVMTRSEDGFVICSFEG